MAPGKPELNPSNSTILKENEKKKALPEVKLIKENLGGNIKESSCIDASKKRRHLKQDENVSPPIASLEFFATLLIDACEGRDDAKHDMPGVNLQEKLAPREINEKVLRISEEYL